MRHTNKCVPLREWLVALRRHLLWASLAPFLTRTPRPALVDSYTFLGFHLDLLSLAEALLNQPAFPVFFLWFLQISKFLHFKIPEHMKISYFCFSHDSAKWENGFFFFGLILVFGLYWVHCPNTYFQEMSVGLLAWALGINVCGRI